MGRGAGRAVWGSEDLSLTVQLPMLVNSVPASHLKAPSQDEGGTC